MREPPKVADWRVCVLTQKSSTPEPSAEFGKLCMLELASFIAAASLGGGIDTEPGRCQSTCAGSAELGPAQRPYTAAAVEACMEKVRRLNYNQTASGLVGGFSLTPWPSGYSIGSANWTLTDGNMSVAIIGASTVSPILRHPLPVQLQHLRHFDVAILGDLLPRHRAHTLAPPPPPAHEGGRASGWHPLPWPKLSQVVTAVRSTLQDGGNVLLPVQLGSTSMDLLDALGTGLSGDSLTCHAPMYVISPTGRNVLGYCEILSEWLRPRPPPASDSNVGIHRHFQPESPFIHEKLEQSARLHIVADVHALHACYFEPCVVMAGHPSLRMGPCVHFLRRWGRGEKNALILTDAYWNVRENLTRAALAKSVLLSPHQPLHMKLLVTPLDLRLNKEQALYLLDLLGASHAIGPAAWLAADPSTAVKFSGLYHGSMSEASCYLHMPSVSALLSVDVASAARVATVGEARACKIWCDVLDAHGPRRLVPARAAGEAWEAGCARGEAGGPGARGVEGLMMWQQVLYGKVTAHALCAELSRLGYTDCVVSPKSADCVCMC